MKEKSAEIADEELVRRAVNDGDQTAYTILHERYREQLEIFVRDMLASYTDDPADIAQIALFKAFSSLDRYEPSYKFSTWLYNIAKNTAIDALRKQRVNMEHGFYGVSKSPEDEYISMQSLSEVMSRIKSLEPKYRQVAELRFIKELAYDEIATLTGLPLNTVRTRIRRAREQLKDLEERLL